MVIKNRIVWKLIVIVCVVLITQLPYIYALIKEENDFVFGGFLLNPIDGYSYLAKMYEGWSGEWKFTLPYTAEVGNGSYLFTFYIVLGHLARIFNLPLLGVFHGARLITTIVMLLAIARFYELTLSDERLQMAAFAVSSLGSGLGWLAIFLRMTTSDFWVAEGYPFLSAYANPHFPLGLGLLVWIITPHEEANKLLPISRVIYSLSSFGLGLISPFGVLIAILITGSAFFVAILFQNLERFKTILEQTKGYGNRFIWIVIGGSPVVLYEYWVQKSDPLLSIWNAQNQTPAPRLLDFILSFSPALVFALLGAWSVMRKPEVKSCILLLWIGVSFLMVYAPTSLQRRFLMGLFIPLSVLAIIGLDVFQNGATNQNVSRKFIARFLLFLILSLPTNVIIILSSLHGISTHNELVYIHKSEMDAFHWIEGNSSHRSVFLASPETGLLIPAFTGRRVIFGHPYETVNAEQEERWVKSFFDTKITEGSLKETLSKASHQVDFIFYGPREGEISLPGSAVVIASEFFPVYQNNEVTIYRVDK